MFPLSLPPRARPLAADSTGAEARRRRAMSPS